MGVVVQLNKSASCRGYRHTPERLGNDQMKKAMHITVTIIIMLIASRFLVRIVDATVQIDEDIGALVVLLAVINICIGGISYLVYQKYQNKKK